ncbi:MAG: hypothetical protein ACOZNI_04400 [Myxococcota bacterium]
MSGLGQLIASLVEATGGHLPAWGLPAFFVGLTVLAWPMVRRNDRTGKARKLLQAAAHAPDRDRLEAEALALVEGHPVGLVVVADEALKAGRKELAARALAALRRTGKRDVDALRIARDLEGPQPGTPMEAAIVVERLIEQGMKEEARERLGRWRRRWPQDEELAQLERAAERG